jgi:hypothetical protein
MTLNAYSASVFDTPVNGAGGSRLQALESLSQAMREDSHASLKALTDPTGGLLIDHTNDLSKAFRRIDDDRRSYYLLTYTPRNSTFNGEWRRVEVRVPGRRLQVRGRNGYLAVRTPAGIPVLGYQMPALTALEQQPAPHDLALQARTFVFPDASGKMRVPILMRADAHALQFDLASHGYHAEFAMVARVIDATGAIVRLASQPYTLSGARDQVDTVRAGSILFYRQPELPPGRYTLEGVIYDAVGKRAGVVRSPLDVPAIADDAGPRVSSLVLVMAAERVEAGDLHADNPFYLGDVLVYPNLGEPVHRGSAEQPGKLGFYLTIQTRPGDRASAVLQVRRRYAHADSVMADLPLPLGEPDATGRIQQIGRFPLQGLPAGDYIVRVVVSAHGREERRDALLRLID